MPLFTDLLVWQKSMDLVEAVYAAIREFPRDEMYGLTSQMSRAAVSIPSNIAEGQGRESSGSFVQLLRIALGSTRELETQVMISARLKYLTEADGSQLRVRVVEVAKMLRGLIRSFEADR